MSQKRATRQRAEGDGPPPPYKWAYVGMLGSKRQVISTSIERRPSNASGLGCPDLGFDPFSPGRQTTKPPSGLERACIRRALFKLFRLSRHAAAVVFGERFVSQILAMLVFLRFD
jgi:hypothetical protein